MGGRGTSTQQTAQNDAENGEVRRSSGSRYGHRGESSRWESSKQSHDVFETSYMKAQDVNIVKELQANAGLGKVQVG